MSGINIAVVVAIDGRTARAARAATTRTEAEEALPTCRSGRERYPQPGAQIEAAAEAAAITEAGWIRGAEALGVRRQRRQWWRPG